jgi:hypothetical protein
MVVMDIMAAMAMVLNQDILKNLPKRKPYRHTEDWRGGGINGLANLWMKV